MRECRENTAAPILFVALRFPGFSFCGLGLGNLSLWGLGCGSDLHSGSRQEETFVTTENSGASGLPWMGRMVKAAVVLALLADAALEGRLDLRNARLRTLLPLTS